MKRILLMLALFYLSYPAFCQTRMIINKMNGSADTLLLAEIKNITFSTTLGQGLVAYYPFTGNAMDTSGNNNNATFNNATPVADQNGNANRAFSFNGSDQYIEVPNSPSLQSPKSSGTIALWANIGGWYDGRGAFFVCKGHTSEPGQYRIGLDRIDSSFYIVFNTESGPVLVPGKLSQPIQLNTWYHLAVAWKEGSVNFYIDAKSIASGSFSGNVKEDNFKLNIARDMPGSTEYFNGKMDEIRIYNRALSATEIQSLYRLK